VDLKRHNRHEIDALNQRGGRMLSLVDLLEAGTVGLDLAADLALVAAQGRSFLAAAGPGGVGKTTLMGALLAFLPPGTRIVPIAGPQTLDHLERHPPQEPQCLVVHEIGPGAWYAYLWGRDVGRYVRLAAGPHRSLASNLHAETYPEAADQLARLGVASHDLGRIDALAFMALVNGRRRVTSVWRATGDERHHEQTWRLAPDGHTFERAAPAPDDTQLGAFRECLDRACRDAVRPIEELRARALNQLFGDAT